jgi:hypothetical protein
MKALSKKSAMIAAILGAAGIAGLMLAHAQETGTVTKKPVHAETINPELAAELAAVEQLPTIAADTEPRVGTFYSAQCPYWPPLPCNFYGVPVWDLGDGIYLLDDLQINYAEIEAEATASATTMSANVKPMGGGFSPDDQTQSGFPYLTIAPTGTNQLLITVINTNPATYYLQMTPVLANTNYPFAIIANGVAGQSNFTVNIGPFADEFFRVFMATNNPWQGIAVFIDSPANGATVQ